MSTPDRPTEAFAIQVATDATGNRPLTARRFTTGSSHYVYEVQFYGRPSVVVRIGNYEARQAMHGAVKLSNLLRPLGVPLPAILSANTENELPWLVLEHLSGTDLGAVIADLRSEQLEAIAARVAQAQAIAGKTASAGRYGYAADPELAPYSSWSQVLDKSLERSRRRIAVAGLFEASLVDKLQLIIVNHRDELNQIEPTPFLHDTTTKNVIIANSGEMSGLVDVDELCFGDPRYPAALTLAVLLGYGGPTEYVNAWLHHARALDDRIFRLYVSIFLLDLMAEHGQAFNGNEQPSVPDTRASLHKAYEDSLKLAVR